MAAIYKRELKAYFQSFIGFLFIGATLCVIGLYFTVYTLFYGYPYMSYAVSSAVFLFFISIPILTMRILSEERKQKTDQLILTAPVSVGNIVLGKFLALLSIFLIPIVVISTYPLILTAFGSVPLAESYLAILGFFLYGMACISIGIWVSSLTESQVIAAVISFGLLFVGYIMDGICSLISSTGNWLTKVLGCLDMYNRFISMLNGTLDISAVIYFVSFTALMLFLTAQSIQKRRYSVSVKNLQFGAYSTGLIAVGIVLTVLINLFAGELPSSVKTVDVTSQKIYSITDITKDFLKELDEDITIYVLAGETSKDTTLSTTLERYTEASGHITVEYVDPAVNPRFYMQYTDSSVTTNSMIVVGEKRHKVINYSNVYATEMDYTTYATSTTGYDGEGQITSALAYVTSESMPKVYILEGHGELSLSATFTGAIEKENMEYESINLMNYDAVPEDAQCLIIHAPTSDFSEDDLGKILDFLNKGGNALVVSTWTEQELPNFNKLLEAYGLSVAEGLVIEQDQNAYYQNQTFLLPEVMYDEMTAGVYNSYYVFVPYAQGIRVPETEEGSEVTYTTLLETSDSAFARSTLENVDLYEMKEGDEAGPFAIGVRADKVVEDKNSTLVLYSSEYLFEDSANQMVSGANLLLFSGTIGNMTENEISVSVPVKSYEVSTLMISQSSIVLLALATAIILPLGLLIIGFVIWFRRRKR